MPPSSSRSVPTARFAGTSRPARGPTRMGARRRRSGTSRHGMSIRTCAVPGTDARCWRQPRRGRGTGGIARWRRTRCSTTASATGRTRRPDTSRWIGSFNPASRSTEPADSLGGGVHAHSSLAARGFAAAALTLSLGLPACASGPSLAQAAIPPEKSMTRRASGTFEVKLVPQSPGDYADAATLARMTIDKQFRGDLEATSKGQMLSAGTASANSAGYVAIERVTGSLHGRTGTFVLQHSATMDRGAPQLVVTVVPDSGTG